MTYKDNWFLQFPRKIGFPKKALCRTEEEFQELYNFANGVSTKLYTYLYQCDDDGFMDEVTLDLIAYDIDWENSFETMKELHDLFVAKKWAHQVMFSTGGFWIYVFCTPRTYKKEMAKGKLAAMQDYCIRGTNLKFGNPKECPLDDSIRGDVERLTRLPSSFDRNRERYAIFLTEDDIQKGREHIENISSNCGKTKRRFEIHTFHGDLAVDPDNLEAAPPLRRNIYGDVVEMTFEDEENILPEGISEKHKKILDSMPKFVQKWVTDADVATWQARAYATLWLREKGYSKSETESFLKPFYSQHPRNDEFSNNWEHYKKVAQTSDHIYKRTDMKFPSYKTLWEMGLCPYSYVEKNGPFNSPVYR